MANAYRSSIGDYMPEKEIEIEKEIKKDYKGLRLRRDYESIYAASNKILV